ncbi:hypothetical protein FHS52_001705 [Erythromicrobium ramosum]|jgi:hypothetical protein|uniref:17 kDa surface antigen n=1 Tax=Erythrobacter ramosus TaxID=35811 RepID=A0A6I4UJU7_9SPHN|nr:glycine zipper 2TM domain-containing protein [Erythrobacter ramosus]MBB3775736.1 hypothetical protein [Erythrobacter ramosus]MXP39170.1 glycine zipper 2TM domain-containing protein [Erythrobacter ramosus]
MKNLALLAAAAGSMAVFAAPAQAAELPAAPASIFASFNDNAAPFTTVAAWGDDDDDWRDRRDRRRYRDRDRDWDDRGRRLSRNDRVWRGNDGRYHCRRDNGTTGLVVGAVGGALLGRTVDTRGDRTLGTILGGLAGGLLGREIDRGEARCR